MKNNAKQLGATAIIGARIDVRTIKRKRPGYVSSCWYGTAIKKLIKGGGNYKKVKRVKTHRKKL